MCRMLYIYILLVILTFSSLKAEDKKNQDREAIKKMCGCYEVSFNFAETFQYTDNPDYVPSKNKHSKGLEWVELVEDKDNKIIMQHLLIVGKDDSKSVIKHWRQDWLYENRELYTYFKDNMWKYNLLNPEDVKGEWTQKVYQVDDSPRYEGSGTWIHIDGKSYWENTTDAPLPRREYTVRDDYNLMIRQNRHEITDYGWLHEQDNQKVVRVSDTEQNILAEEKGYNYYRKVEDSRCQLAIDWWKDNHSIWTEVRNKWDEVFERDNNLVLLQKVDEKRLSQHLFQENLTSQDVDKIIDSFLVK